MATGTLTGLQHRCYIGGWNSWTNVGSASQYIGSATNHPYCLKFTVPNDNIINATLTFSFNIVKGNTGTGDSGTITWDIRTAGPATGTSKQGSSIGTGTWSVSGITASSKTKTFSTSRISSLTKGGTYYLWLTSDVLFQAYSGSSYYSGSINYTNYTACKAPASVTASGIVTPSGTFTVSWSGARGGTNNAISSYQIYWKVSSDGSAPTTSNYTGTKNITSTSTSGSTSITLSSATRGYKVVCGVVARGSAGSSYYSGIKTGGSIIVNSLPSAPKVTVDKTFLLSNEDSVTFSNITVGTDVDTNQTKTVWYSTSQDTNKTKITGSSLIQKINNSITYYFYTYDGLEYGNAKTIEIIKNIKPQINSVSGIVPTYTFAGEEGKKDLQLGYAYTILPTISVNKTGNLTIFIDMDASNTTDSASYSYTETFTQKLTSTSEFTPNNNYNIYTRAIAHFGSTIMSNTNIKWRLGFQLSDNNEHSEIVYYPSNQTFYTIAHSAELKGVYNQFADSNIIGTLNGYVRKQVRFKFDNDTSVPNISISAKIGNSEVKPLTSAITTKNDYKYIDLTLPDNIIGNSVINITILFTDSDSQPTKTSEYSRTVIETLIPTLESFSHHAETIYPFTSKDTDTFEIKINWPFGSYNALNDNTLSNFNCSTQKTDGVHYDAIKFIHISNETNKSVLKQLDWQKENDWLVANPSTADMYGWNKELGYDTYSGIKTYFCQFQITNLFGDTFVLNLNEPRYFNFNELAQGLLIKSIEWATPNEPTKWGTFNIGSNAAQEGMYLKFNLEFNLFTKETITVQLKRKINNEENVSISKTYPIGAEGLSYANDPNPQTSASNNISLVYGPVGTISDTEKRVWSFQITNTRGTTESAGVEMKVLKQIAPDISFTSCSVDQNYKISYKFKQTNSGGGSIVNYLCDYDNKNELSSKSLNNPLSDGTSSGTIDPNETNWEVKSICIKSIQTVNGLITSRKEYYSNYIIVYKVTPTVAYRKNQLGINTDNPDSKYIIDIRPTSGYKKIRLYDGRSDIIELDLSKVYDSNNNISYPAIAVKKGTTEYTLFFD